MPTRGTAKRLKTTHIPMPAPMLGKAREEGLHGVEMM